ncbi:MAG TPA: hypothetical protein VFU03_02775 [Gemmatimonadales bacterium]|nr:hypothetical protein [Gemmatimonadales bacterium]
MDGHRPLLLLLLAACTGGGDNTQTAQTAKTADSTADTASTVTITPPHTTVDSTVGWSRLQDLLRYETSKVTMVMEAPGRKASVRMKDGRLYHAIEPHAGDIIQLVHEIDKTGTIMVVAE